MKQMYDLSLTYAKLIGEVEGKVKQLEGLPFTNLKEIERLSSSSESSSSEVVNQCKHFCKRCHVRKVRRSIDLCPVCRETDTCMNCHKNKRKKKGGLCYKCYIAKTGEKKICVECNKNVVRSYGLCAGCQMKYNNNGPLADSCVRCGTTPSPWVERDGTRVCWDCFSDKCSKCGYRKGVSGKKGERVCRKCNNSNCVMCKVNYGRFAMGESKVCQSCHNGKCVTCGIRIGILGKQGSKECKPCYYAGKGN